MKLDKKLTINRDVANATNLADRLSDRDLATIGNLTWQGYNKDKFSRLEWMARNEAGMNLAMQIARDKNFPWPGSANVIFPLITIAALQFSARSYSNLIQGTDIVRYRVVGEDRSGEKRRQADKISRHMSWQVLEEDMPWEEQHDRLLINLSIVGTSFIKTYFSPRLKHNVSELVLAKDLVMDYYAKSVEACARKTHIIPQYRNEIYEKAAAEVYCREILDSEWFNRPAVLSEDTSKSDARQGISPSSPDHDTPFTTLEQHRLLDLDQDGYYEPYIVTIEESSRKVLRIVARYNEESIEKLGNRILRIHPEEYFTKYSFIPSVDGGIYDIGFGTLLGPLNEAVNSGINQLLDAGTMQNSIGGFLGRGAKIRGGNYTMAPWEWKRVDSTGDDLRKNMVPFPDRQPSAVMFQLLGLLINYTDRVSGSVDQMVGENPGQNTPAETARTTIEQGMQIYSVIFKRVWRSMKEEFKKLHKLNAVFLPVSQPFGADGKEIRREDYNGSPDHVVPVADPRITSTGQRISQAMMIKQAAMTSPGYDPEAVERNWLRAVQVEGMDELYPGLEKRPPSKDPKVQVEEMKLKARQVAVERRNQVYMIQILEDRQKNMAEIAKLKAETVKILAEVGIQRDDQRLRAYEIAINALMERDKVMADREKALKEEGVSYGGLDQAGGLRGVESAGDNQGALPALPGMEGSPEGTMGEGEF